MDENDVSELHSIDRLRTRKKPIYPISDGLRKYLRRYTREVDLPVSYEQLLDYADGVPLIDADGQDTLWETVFYAPEMWERMSEGLKYIYALLRAGGDTSVMGHLYVDRVDYCTFGNTNPFRVRIVNAYNDNQDYYYVKRGDASRVYGLELEHLLTPNRMHYFTDKTTLIEEHVAGIPGDIYIKAWLDDHRLRPIRLAKELVKFNERCFVRLLGDMRSYNFVMVLTPDFEDYHVRIRAMDFDQQSYSGRINFYRPQYFKDNNPLVFFCMEHLNMETARQYQREEQALMYRRIQIIAHRLATLVNHMCGDRIAPDEKVHQLRSALAEHYGNPRFEKGRCMGDLVRESLETLARNLKELG